MVRWMPPNPSSPSSKSGRENNLRRFWYILDLVNPGVMGTFLEYNKEYIEPIRGGQKKGAKEVVVVLKNRAIEEFNGRFRSWFLRRTKEEVLDQINVGSHKLKVHENEAANANNKVEKPTPLSSCQSSSSTHISEQVGSEMFIVGSTPPAVKAKQFSEIAKWYGYGNVEEFAKDVCSCGGNCWENFTLIRSRRCEFLRRFPGSLLKWFLHLL